MYRKQCSAPGQEERQEMNVPCYMVDI